MKKEMRKKMIKVREGLSEQEVINNSEAVFRTLRNLKAYQDASCVMLYISFRNEIMTRAIINDLLNNGKRVFIPVTVHDTKAIIVSELLDYDQDLQVGNFGVLEAKPETLRPTEPSLLDLVLVPGVAFDERGYRIGFGAGYYDRFLPALREGAITIALAHEIQMVDKVENDQYDVPVDYVLTDKRFIKVDTFSKYY